MLLECRNEEIACLATELETITQAIIQNGELFDVIKKHFQPSYLLLSPQFRPLLIIWQTIYRCIEKHRSFPKADTILAVLSNYILKNPDNKDAHKAYQIVNDAKNSQPILLDKEYIRDRFRFLAELNFRNKAAVKLYESNGQIGALLQIFEDIVKGEYLRAISDIPDNLGEIPLDLSFYRDTAIRYPYGVEFVDFLINGGSEHPEVSVLLGPTGSGKSFLSLQLCSQWAITNNDPDKVCAYFSYELSKPKFCSRLFCQICRISMGEFAEMVKKNPDELTQEEKLRIQRIQEVFQKIRVYDFSGHVDTSSGEPRVYGSGGIDEVVSALDRVTDSGKKIEFVIIDWLGAAITAQAKKEQDRLALIRLYQDWPIEAYRKIATKFDCAVWLVHQIAGQKEKKATTAIFHHSDASWSKNLAQYAFNVLTLGNKDADNCLILAPTKVRSGERKTPVIIKFNPATTLFERVEKDFVVDYDKFKIRDLSEEEEEDGGS